jgi:hypothetical protein
MLIPPRPKPSNVFDILAPDQVRCANCLKVGRKAWSDEEAEAEFRKNFGPDAEAGNEILCDDCYNVMLMMIRIAGQDNRRRRLS